MKVLKTILHGLSLFSLTLVVSIGIAILGVTLNITDRETVMSWPKDAKVYENATDQLLILAEQGGQDEDGNNKDDEGGLGEILNSTTIDSDEVRAAVAQTYDAAYWQNTAETFINAIYDWLEGATPKPVFTLDFSAKTDELAANIEPVIANDLAKLPVCNLNNILKDLDPFNATCLPPKISPQEAASQFTDNLNGADSFLNEAQFSNEDLDLSEDVQTNAPRAFKAANRLPLFALLLTFILGIVAIFTSKSYLRGARKLGLLVFSLGLVGWIGWFVSTKITDSLPTLNAGPGDEFQASVSDKIVEPLALTAWSDIANTGMWLSVWVVVVGTLLWLGAFMWHKVQHGNEAEAIAQRSGAGSPKSPDDKLPEPKDPEEYSSNNKNPTQPLKST